MKIVLFTVNCKYINVLGPVLSQTGLQPISVICMCVLSNILNNKYFLYMLVKSFFCEPSAETIISSPSSTKEGWFSATLFCLSSLCDVVYFIPLVQVLVRFKLSDKLRSTADPTNAFGAFNVADPEA